ncbi:hypothetical protein Tco_1306495 [Tanacetum coccineum]
MELLRLSNTILFVQNPFPLQLCSLLEAFEGPDGPVYWEDTQLQVAGQAGVGHWPLALRPFIFLDLLTKILAQVSVESEG